MDKLQKIVLAAAAVVCTATIAVTGLTRPQAGKTEAPSPLIAHDEAAVKGVPEIPDESLYYSPLEIPLSNGTCKASLAAAPKLNDDGIDVYFTNSEESTVELRLVVFDENENIIGSSGIIRSGEYVQSIALQGNAESGQPLKVKILTYDCDTYYSLGTATATVMVK